MSWKEVLKLLDGGLSSGAVASEALCEMTPEDQLQDLLHHLITSTISSEKETTRLNGALVLQKLTQQHRIILLDLMKYGKFSFSHSLILSFSSLILNLSAQSDGPLLQIEEIEIEEMLSSGKELFNKVEEVTVDIKDLYSGNWVGKQRAALRRRLGKESGNSDDATATQYISLRGMIKPSDVALKVTETSTTSPLLVPSSLDLTDSNETWFVRMMRYLLAGLVHSQWEYRHGHCLGLIAIFQGLNLLQTDSSAGHRSQLPIFLLEDIITSTLTVLVLDRYLDVEGSPENYRTYFLHSEVSEEFSNEFVSPVKETAARLLSIVCSTVGSLDDQFAILCISKILSFCYLNASTSAARDLSHWSVIQSGYITMKHLLRIPECFSFMIAAGQGQSLFESIRQGLSESNEEIRYEALSCLLSLKNVNLLTVSSETIEFVSSHVKSVLLALPQIANISSDFLITTFPLLAEVFSLYFLSPHLQTPELFHSVLEDSCCAMLAQYSRLLKTSSGREHLPIIEKSCRKVLQKIIDFIQQVLDLELLSSFASDISSALLRTSIRLLCDLILIPLHFSEFPIVDLQSLVNGITLHSEIYSMKPNDMDPFPTSVPRLLSLRPLLSLVDRLMVGPDGAEEPIQFTSHLTLQLLKAVADQVIQPLQPLAAEPDSISTRSSRKRKRVAKGPSSPPDQPLDSLPQVELHVPKHNLNFTMTLQLFRIDSYRLENGMVLAASLTELLSHSSLHSLDKTLLLETISSSMEHLFNSVLGTSSGIESPQRGEDILPIFIIVNEAGSLVDTPPLQKRKGVELFNLQCTKLLWFCWTTLSLVQSLLLQKDICQFSRDNLRDIVQLFDRMISSLSSLQSLEEFQPTLLSELKLCLQMFAILEQTFFQHSLSSDSLRGFSQSIPNSSFHSSFHAKILSSLFCQDPHRTIQQLEQFLLFHYRHSPKTRHFCLECGRLSPHDDQDQDHQQSTLLADWIVFYLTSSEVKDFNSGSVANRFLNLTIGNSPADITESMSLSALMALVVWIHFSRPSTAVLDSLVGAGLVEKIFEFVSVCGVSSVAKKKPSRALLVPSSEEDLSCSCESTEQIVSSEFPFKLAVVALMLLCDRSSSASFTPDAPLSVSHTHFSIVNRISTLASNSLRNYQVGDPKPLMAVAILFFQLAHQLRERLLPDYEHWVEISIEGTAHCSSKPTRKYFALTLRTLVPLAPLLLRSLRWKNTLGAPAAPQTCDLVGGVFLSQYPLLSERYLSSSASSLDQSSSGSAVRNREEHLRELILKLETSSENVQTRSAELSRLLRPYQIKGIEWILQLWTSGLGGVLADEMGLGKTLQTLTAIALKRVHYGAQRPSLVACPAVLITHWETEIEKYFPPVVITPYKLASLIESAQLNREGLAVAKRGLLTKKDALLERYSYLQCVEHVLNSLAPNSVLLASYDLLRKISQQSLTTEELSTLNLPDCTDLRSFLFEVIVADEAHCLRNPHTETSQAIFALKGISRLAVTGTPVQNRVEDIWSVMNFCMPQFLGDFIQFNESILKPIKRAFADAECSSLNVKTSRDQTEKVINISAEGLSLLRSLHKQILPFLLRRTKAIALPDLPPKIVKDIYCPLSKRQKLLYASFQRGLRLSDDLLEKELLDHLRGGRSSSAVAPTSSVIHPFQALASLKKICIHPGLVLNETERGEEEQEFRLEESGKLCLLFSVLIDQEVVSCDQETVKKLRQVWRSFPELPPFPVSLERSEDFEEAEEELEEEVESDDEIGEPPPSSFTSPSQDPVISSPPSSSRRKKCLIFAEHRETLDLVLDHFSELFPGVLCVLMDGRTVARKRAETAMIFNSDLHDSPQILLLTTSSCGLGLNLSAAEIVIFVEHSWNPFVDLQAMDRVHRLGQVRTVTVFKLLAESTIESRISYLQQLKTLIAEEISVGTDASSQLVTGKVPGTVQGHQEQVEESIQHAILSSLFPS